MGDIYDLGKTLRHAHYRRLFTGVCYGMIAGTGFAIIFMIIGMFFGGRSLNFFFVCLLLGMVGNMGGVAAAFRNGISQDGLDVLKGQARNWNAITILPSFLLCLYRTLKRAIQEFIGGWQS